MPPDSHKTASLFSATTIVHRNHDEKNNNIPTSKPQDRQLKPLQTTTGKKPLYSPAKTSSASKQKTKSSVDKKVASLGILTTKKDTGIPLSTLKASAKLTKHS